MLDLVIVGAGISGISAACHLRRDCPDKEFVILEARDHLGGTWDLFRYPGIRSDSDMHTFGFEFKPWTNPKALADGPSILNYLNEAVDEYGFRDEIHFGHKVVSAAFSSADDCWTVTVANKDGKQEHYKSRLLFMCSGYYNYDAGYTPDIPGRERFQGKLIHPQHWPKKLDYTHQKVAVIGSGATAVTLVPAMTDIAAKVTMIQRSPTYIVSRPGTDRFANLLRKFLPEKLAYRLVRFRNIHLQNYFYQRMRKNPDQARAKLMHLLRKEVDPRIDIDKHFTPRYNPWDQRLCLVPDADLFKALNAGTAEVVTGEIDHIDETGVQMRSGEHIKADIIVMATGLQLQLLAGIPFSLDGEPIDFHQHYFYQGMMFSGIPNLIQTFGYINASWTLRADLNSRFVCDLLKTMDARHATRCVPQLRPDESGMQPKDWITGFSPGYMQRGMHLFPRQGEHAPWHNTQDYLLDRKLLKHGIPDDGVLQFS